MYIISNEQYAIKGKDTVSPQEIKHCNVFYNIGRRHWDVSLWRIKWWHSLCERWADSSNDLSRIPSNMANNKGETEKTGDLNAYSFSPRTIHQIDNRGKSKKDFNKRSGKRNLREAS